MRIYQSTDLQAHSILRLDEKASHHLAKVLRVQVGEHLTLFNGRGGEFAAEITHIDKKAVTVSITDYLAREVESPLNICLAQGIARGEKMDFIIQKAVELGVKHIVPLLTERCNVRLDHEREQKRLQHWQGVIISACEQSGRNCIPEISAPISLPEWLPTVQADKAFVLSPHVTNPLIAEKLPQDSSITLLLGPEGGLSDQEVESACKNNFSPLILGPRILRTETATVAALTVMQCLYGDFLGGPSPG